MIPPSDSLVWKRLVSGEKRLRSAHVGVNMLIFNSGLRYRRNPTHAVLGDLAQKAHEYFEKYERTLASELTQLLPQNRSMLMSVSDACRLVEAGTPLLAAGSEAALAQLPRGCWIGGTIPYFMDESGGLCSEHDVFVTRLPAFATATVTAVYAADRLAHITGDAPDNGFSAVIIPAWSTCHRRFAQDAPTYPGAFVKPVVGWISGVHLAQVATATPRVFDGVTGTVSTDAAVVMHVTLPATKLADVEAVNVFRQGDGPTLMFNESGFAVTECLVGGTPTGLATYFRAAGIDTRLPLTADYNGSVVNVSIQRVDDQTGEVNFYAPVFQGVEYKLAAPVPDYVAAFEAVLQGSTTESTFACNCILNYLYGGLEGKRIGSVTGPVTFGEIAHQLLNQTLVRLTIQDVA